MTIKYAITRLRNKLSRDKVVIDKIDREALNSIIDYYNFTESKQLKENVLFHKLFIYIFLNRVMVYGNSTDMALDSIEQVLKQPLSVSYKAFSDNASYFKTISMLNKLGYSDKFPVDLTDGDIEENDRIINENREEIKKSILGGFSADKAMKFIEDSVSEMILKYRNND